jgi:enoyl-CoA hydratase
MTPSETSDDRVLRVGRTEAIAIVTLDRPTSRNALDARLRLELYEAMRTLEDDEDIRAVVLTGSDPAFCAGLDLKELASDPASLGGGFAEGADLRRPIPEMSTPVIGAINGAAITGGFELALACDFLVASERARFADTHARVGIMPGWGLTVLLAEAVGVRRAKELSATGNFLDASTAYDWGLVNHVVPHDELLPRALALAEDVAGNDPAGVAHIFGTYDEGIACTRAEALDIETRRSIDWLNSGRHGDLDARRRAVTERGRSQNG